MEGGSVCEADLNFNAQLMWTNDQMTVTGPTRELHGSGQQTGREDYVLNYVIVVLRWM